MSFERGAVFQTRWQHADISSRLRAAHTDSARRDQFTLATIRERNEYDVFTMPVSREFAGAEPAVFELDAIPGSFPFTDNCGCLVHNVDYFRREL